MRGSDPKILVLIAPVFALVTAVNVITISYAKSLFIANNPYDALPWMFIGGGIFATLLTLFCVPYLYSLFDDIRAAAHTLVGWVVRGRNSVSSES